MKTSLKIILAGACVARLFLGTLIAAEADKAAATDPTKGVKIENVTWHSLWYIKFKPGKAERAMAIVERFEKAWEKAQMPPATNLRMHSGRWNLVIIFTLAEGLSSLEWKVTPYDAKFQQALAEQEGGADKAEALFTEFNDCVADEQGEIAFAPKKK